MKKVLQILGLVLVVLVVAAGAVYLWAGSAANRRLARTYTTHTVDFPIPFPLSEEEVRRRRLTPEAAAREARAQAMERGQHLVEARYVCIECHGRDFSGGVMVDAPPIGRLFGPNLTSGKGSRTENFQPADWDRIVRHGVRRDGTPAVMPSGEFAGMSDQELSDIVLYVTSQPAVDHEIPPRTFGPVGKLLMATGKLTLSADLIQPHDALHLVSPPAAAATVEFGRHLANICTGCHAQDLAGGPIVGGDPAWPAAANLTPHATGLAGWTFEQFVVALREAKRPDGTALRAPMSGMPAYAQKMTDVELEALWNYLQSVPALPRRQ